MNDTDFTDMADRIGRALGEHLGGRFNVLANLRKEQEAGSPTRTIEIVDRWSDQDVTIEIRRGVKSSSHAQL